MHTVPGQSHCLAAATTKLNVKCPQARSLAGSAYFLLQQSSTITLQPLWDKP